MNVCHKLYIDIQEEAYIKDVLEKLKFQFVSQDHAFWRAKNPALSITFYKNGTFMIQGDKEDISPVLRQITGKAGNTREESILGLDESGKGDYFGPLVLSGAVINKNSYEYIQSAGVQDSKKLSDKRIQEIFEEIKNKIIWKVRVIIPEEYNDLYNQYQNMNKLLVGEYIKLIRSFDLTSYDSIILDKFSQSDSQNQEIRISTDKKMNITEKAEKFLSVAAASIIARFHFIEWFKDGNYPKGCGKAAGELFLKLRREMPVSDFKKIGRLHFKSELSLF